ncbi:hypothetical protein C8Q77DRAFT_1133607 [Trametes polyzona]|nr:hypothetical protein C8Q77DRAFT_1133607 [Trametes polyzona]
MRGVLPTSGKPHIWATSRDELVQILPEFGQVRNDVVFGSTETPLLFLEGGAWPDDQWDGGNVIELKMVREFVRTLPEGPAAPVHNVAALDTAVEAPSPTVPNARARTPEGLPPVIMQGGYYVFTGEAPAECEDVIENRLPIVHSTPHATPSAIATLEPAKNATPPAPDDAPPEIDVLLLARAASMPISIILCRGAELAPFSLPDGCGCAFLGFFFATEVQTQAEVISWDVVQGPDYPMTVVRGRKTWRFRFEWTPGGEDPDAVAVLHAVPWWRGIPDAPSAAANGVNSQPDQCTPIQHPYTLLPLHFLATPAQHICTDADVRTWLGWHCTTCGRLNLQVNLCLQKCGSCSTPNGLPPIAVDYVRQVRGTDPIAFPWDRYPEFVRCVSKDGPGILRTFTYHLTAKATVHHLFTRNRPEAQSEPTRLFSDLQAEVELSTELASARGRNGIGPYYSRTFSPLLTGTSAGDDWWETNAPASVSQARQLMLQCARGLSPTPDWTIGNLAISSWRTAGNKKGSAFLADKSPIVLLCLGADVEVTFWQRRSERTALGPSRAATSSASPAPTAEEDELIVDIGDDDDAEFLPAGTPLPSSSVQSKAKSKGRGTTPPPKERAGARKDLEDVLMVTLVHGDLLLVHGAVLEYSIKRTGMSIVLFGRQ